MKKLLFLLMLLSCWTIEAARVQITFNLGVQIGVVADNPYYPQIGVTTTDTEINSIFSTHSVQSCFGTHYPINQLDNIIIFADYNGSDINSFINDLEANSSVKKVRISPNSQAFNYIYADLLYIKLVDNTNGNPTGVNANQNIVTTNAQLNTIFDNHDVSMMLATVGYYQIYFDGDILQLTMELNDLNNVIESVSNMHSAMLSNPEFEQTTATISPNPFSSTVAIDTDELISNYSLSEISGKVLVSTNSKSELDMVSSSLNSGIYILNLQFDEGKSANYKLVKK